MVAGRGRGEDTKDRPPPSVRKPGRPGRGQAAPEVVKRLPASAGLGFAGTGRKELSRLRALEEGSAAINSEPREGGRELTQDVAGARAV